MLQSGILHTAILAAFIALLIYRRFRRTVGRQKVVPSRLLIRMALLAFVGCAVLAALLAAFSPVRVLEVLAGLAAGVGAAWYGLRRTSFERRQDGVYYTPNLYVGLAVSALFLARLIYVLAVYGFSAFSDPQQAPYHPVTGVIAFLFIGYYVAYYVGVILRSREIVKGS
jgi:hypothetical protein